MRSVLWIVGLLVAATPVQMSECTGDDDVTPVPTPVPTPASELNWYYTCGDPVCSGYTPPEGDIPLCTDQKEGAPCSVEGEMCDPQDGCNALMVCAAEDPKAYGCPISRRAYKEDINYLDEQAKARIHDELMRVKLATYHYKGEDETAPSRLGFIIDDAPNSPAVLPSKERVDLYGYTSMTVAALQVQSRQLEKLQQEIAAMKQELEATHKQLEQCKAR